MLVLGRRIGERFIIADNIVIEVLGFRDGNVRIGISAPRDIEILREEVYNRVKEKPFSDKDIK